MQDIDTLLGQRQQRENEFFIAEDSHQRFYWHRIIMRKHCIQRHSGATKRLRVTLRTTAQNLPYATSTRGTD